MTWQEVIWSHTHSVFITTGVKWTDDSVSFYSKVLLALPSSDEIFQYVWDEATEKFLVRKSPGLKRTFGNIYHHPTKAVQLDTWILMQTLKGFLLLWNSCWPKLTQFQLQKNLVLKIQRDNVLKLVQRGSCGVIQQWDWFCRLESVVMVIENNSNSIKYQNGTTIAEYIICYFIISEKTWMILPPEQILILMQNHSEKPICPYSTGI